MNRLVKTALCSAAIAATTLAALAPADARDRSRHGGHGRPIVVEKHGSDGDLLAAGILGLAVGALVAGALAADQPPPVYGYQPAPTYGRDDFPPAPHEDYRGGYPVTFEPWCRDWYGYCQDRYRSFEPQSGTFLGNDGRRHFCVSG